MGLNLVPISGFTEDSRGESLSEWDCVLCYSITQYCFLSFYVSSSYLGNLGLQLFNSKNAADYYESKNNKIYMFKLSRKEVEKSLHNYVVSLVNRDKKFNSYLFANRQNFVEFEFSHLLSYLKFFKFASEQLYLKENNAKNIRNMPMVDVLGDNIQPGDLVLTYAINKQRLTYGIVISETQVFTETCEKVIAHEVYKLPHYSEEEKQLYQKLSIEYQKSANKGMKRELKRGQVYYSNDSLYIYLGRCKLEAGNIGQTNTVIEAQPVIYEDDVFLKTSNNTFKSASLLDNGSGFKNLNDVIFQTILTSIIVGFRTYPLNDYAVASYFSLVEIKNDLCVSSDSLKKGKKLRYLTEFSLPDVYTLSCNDFNTGEAFKVSLHNILFNFTFLK
jgi:hypothetical protein